jgi:hypothetical protein
MTDRSSRRIRYWMLCMILKARLGHWLIKGLTLMSRVVPLGPVFIRLPSVLKYLPHAWRGRDYSLCQQNLTALGYESTLAKALSCRFGALQWQRALHEQRYPRQRPFDLRAWIADVPWVDPQRLAQVERPTLYLLTHTGEYWMAVASLMARQVRPTRFVIPIWNFNDPFTRRSLQQLEGLGHWVDVLDVADPGTALSMARALKRGDSVVVFCDLPVSLGAMRFGEPLPGQLFHRPAQFVKGPLFLASKLGCDALLMGHQAQLGGKGRVQVLERITTAPLPVMQAQWMAALDGFLAAAPEQWLYLPRLEAFYHRQRSSAKPRPARAARGALR